MDEFAYAAEKFSTARRHLMLPHTEGEAEDIQRAFHECSLGLDHVDRASLPENAETMVKKLEGLMDTAGLDDPSGEGRWAVKARMLTMDDMIQLSDLVDELADWFARED